MNAYGVHRVPWTCLWGRFGVAIEDGRPAGSEVDDVFWACHNPACGADLRLTRRAECEHCPYWEATARIRDAN